MLGGVALVGSTSLGVNKSSWPCLISSFFLCFLSILEDVSPQLSALPVSCHASPAMMDSNPSGAISPINLSLHHGALSQQQIVTNTGAISSLELLLRCYFSILLISSYNTFIYFYSSTLSLLHLCPDLFIFGRNIKFISYVCSDYWLLR